MSSQSLLLGEDNEENTYNPCDRAHSLVHKLHNCTSELPDERQAYRFCYGKSGTSQVSFATLYLAFLDSCRRSLSTALKPDLVKPTHLEQTPEEDQKVPNDPATENPKELVPP